MKLNLSQFCYYCLGWVNTQRFSALSSIGGSKVLSGSSEDPSWSHWSVIASIGRNIKIVQLKNLTRHSTLDTTENRLLVIGVPVKLRASPKEHLGWPRGWIRISRTHSFWETGLLTNPMLIEQGLIYLH